MNIAPLLARCGCLGLRAIVSLHPRGFRLTFGRAVLEESEADIRAAVPLGPARTAAVVGATLLDAGRGAVVERLAAIDRSRRAMQNALLADVRYAVRTLMRDRGFSAVALGTLSVALGLSVTVAVLVNAYLMRGLPYPDSERLFDVLYGSPGTPGPRDLDKLDWRSLEDVIELPIAWDLDNFNLRGGAYPEILQGTWVTQGYVEGFGVRPAIGRNLLPTDFEAGRPTVALISHRLWQTRFNGAADAVGRTFDAYVNDRPDEVETFTIIGVLPAGHWHLNPFTEVLAPLRASTYPYMVRLRPGVTSAVAIDRMSALVRAGNRSLRDDWRVQLISTHSRYVEQIRPLLVATATATGLVMLIACANVGVLLTVRATRRRREMAVRQALGATAGQITRAAALEPLVLGLAATVLGVALAATAVTGIAPLVDHYLGRGAPGGVAALGLGSTAVVVTVAAGLISILFCSVVPIWIARRTPVALALYAGQKGGTEGPAQRRARSVLIAIEVAACLTLLVGAGLTIESAVRTLRVEMGFDARDVIVGRFTLRQRSYPDAAARAAFYERVLTRAGEMGDVRGIAFTNAWPLQQSQTRDVGRDDQGPQLATRAGVVGISPDYFDVLRIALHEGRAFTSGDRAGAEPVTVISRTLAERLWPSSSPIGRRLVVAPPANSAPSVRPSTFVVVGVAGDIRHTHTDDDRADLYVPLLQSPSSGVFVYVRTAGGATAERELRQLLASIDSDVGLGMPRRLADILDLQRAGSRLLAYLLVVFAVFAASLALVGIYGVIAYTVRQREREIAVRLAMGADRSVITRMFIAQGAVVLTAGLALGVLGAVALGRLLQTQLFGVRPADPVVIGWMTAAFATCGLLAVAWPARAAASLDPASALKE